MAEEHKTVFISYRRFEVKRIWRGLLAQDQRYWDADWVGKELNWRPELIEAASKLIAEL